MLSGGRVRDWSGGAAGGWRARTGTAGGARAGDQRTEGVVAISPERTGKAGPRQELVWVIRKGLKEIVCRVREAGGAKGLRLCRWWERRARERGSPRLREGLYVCRFARAMGASARP